MKTHTYILVVHAYKLTYITTTQHTSLKTMNKPAFLCFLVLLALPLRLADKEYRPHPETFDVFAKLDALQVQEAEDDEFEFIDLPDWESDPVDKATLNVDSFGAVGDGVSDDTKVRKML